MSFTKNAGRLAGLLYILASIPAVFALVYVPRPAMDESVAVWGSGVHALAGDHGRKAKATGGSGLYLGDCCLGAFAGFGQIRCLAQDFRIGGHWSATRKCVLSSASFWRVKVPLALK
jgi:hypothetical protein